MQLSHTFDRVIERSVTETGIALAVSLIALAMKRMRRPKYVANDGIEATIVAVQSVLAGDAVSARVTLMPPAGSVMFTASVVSWLPADAQPLPMRLVDWATSVRVGPETNVVNENTFDDDVANGRLANVAWLVNQDQNSEHSPFKVCSGENWTVGHIDAVMSSPYWSHTAIFVIWDDFGGWYDHVPPRVSTAAMRRTRTASDSGSPRW